MRAEPRALLVRLYVPTITDYPYLFRISSLSYGIMINAKITLLFRSQFPFVRNSVGGGRPVIFTDNQYNSTTVVHLRNLPISFVSSFHKTWFLLIALFISKFLFIASMLLIQRLVLFWSLKFGRRGEIGSIPDGIRNFNSYPVCGCVSFICSSSSVSGGGPDILLTIDSGKPVLVRLSIVLIHRLLLSL